MSARAITSIERTRFVSYAAKDGYRWRLLAANHKVIADSGEAYTTRYECRQAIARVRAIAPAAGMVVQP